MQIFLSLCKPLLEKIQTGLTLIAILISLSTAAVAQQTATATEQTENNASGESASLSSRQLKDNECLKQLNSADLVVASIAFKGGVDNTAHLQDLLQRQPWGVGTPDTANEIQAQQKSSSPFLIITLTKEQVLTLDDHRDIIRWVLVHSNTTSCE